MIKKLFNLEEAVLDCHDTSTHYFLGSFLNYLVVVSNHISIWKKRKEGFELTHRVFFDYTFPARAENYREGDDVKPSITLYPIRDEDHEFYKNLFNIQYTNTYDVDLPANILTFDKNMNKLLSRFDELHVLNKELRLDYDELRMLYHNLIWDNGIPLKEVIKFSKNIRRIYIREVKKHNDNIVKDSYQRHGFH